MAVIAQVFLSVTKLNVEFFIFLEQAWAEVQVAQSWLTAAMTSPV